MKKILYLLFLLPFFASAQELRINEILVKNVSSSFDDGYNFSGWVELYNPGTSDVNLKTGNYSFREPTKTGYNVWKAGPIKVPAGGYELVYFERQDSVFYRNDSNHDDSYSANGSRYIDRHADFKLNVEGGTIQLLKGTTVVSSLQYPAQFRNVSYGYDETLDDNYYFTEPSPRASNAGKPRVASPNNFLTAPEFGTTTPGYYTSAVTVSLSAAAGDIYYTLTTPTSKTVTVLGKGQEPTASSIKYDGTPITISSTTVIRAIAIANGKIPSEVVSATYIIDTEANRPKLPYVCLVIDDSYLFDDVFGIYNQGTNGTRRVHDGGITSAGVRIIEGCNGSTSNWNQPWDRPANIEIFDKSGALLTSQEIDIAISGQCTRQNQWYKGFKIKAKEKLGNDKLPNMFPSRPGTKIESIMMRFGGTDDNASTYLRDALIQTTGLGYMDVDIQAYQPAVIYINGEYWGIVNLNERSNDSNIYSNYGYSSDDIYMLEGDEMLYPVSSAGTGTYPIPYGPVEKVNAYNAMYDYVANQDLSDPAKYAQACSLVDVDNFIDYIILQVFSQNWDWPNNNQKIWRPKAEDGRWRFLTYDNDFAFNPCCCGGAMTFSATANGNGCVNTLGSRFGNIFKGFLKSPEFKGRFLTRMQYHADNTFKQSRLTTIVDSLKAQLSPEISRFWSYRGQTSNWSSSVDNVKSQYIVRGAAELTEAKTFLGGSSGVIRLSSNVANAPIVLNGLPLAVNDVYTANYLASTPVSLEAEPVQGYQFYGWLEFPVDTLIQQGDTWKYYGGDVAPYTNLVSRDWTKATYDDSSWSSGIAPLGYGNYGSNSLVPGKGSVKTRIKQGPGTAGPSGPKEQWCTQYFRKAINITNVANKIDFKITYDVDDACVIYVNGTEIHRAGITSGYVVKHNTLGKLPTVTKTTIDVPASAFVEGTNYVTIEVHQSESTSGPSDSSTGYSSDADLYFYASLTCRDTDLSNATELSLTPELNTTLDGSSLVAHAQYTACATCVSKQIYINEVFSAGTTDNGVPDWIELYNAENEPVDVGGYVLSRKDDGAITRQYEIPAGTVIAPKSHLLLEEEIISASGVSNGGVLPFGMSYDHDFTLTLTDIYKVKLDELVVDYTLYTVLPNGTPNQTMSIQRESDGTGAFELKAPTKGVTNGIKTIRELSLLVYPNPVKEQVTVTAESPIKSISITDISGRLVLRNAVAGEISKTVPTANLTNGIYLLTVETEAGKVTKKIVK